MKGAGQPGADEVESADWIQRQAARNRELVQALRQDLDAGEAEAIALSLEIGADLLLMDEHLGRDTARHLDMRYMGLSLKPNAGALSLLSSRTLMPYATSPVFV